MTSASAPDAPFQFYDTTLRDGAQREGISYSVNDKLAVAQILDGLGVGFIEGGWPGALPKDTEFFARAGTELQLRNAVLVAFGATRKARANVRTDPQVAALLALRRVQALVVLHAHMVVRGAAEQVGCFAHTLTCRTV